jgi:hypothetical protein
MPTNLKKLVRARMKLAGEPWSTALHYVRTQAATPQKPVKP